jgi:hypothetical protein
MQHDKMVTVFDLFLIFAGMVALFLVSMVVLSYLGGPTAEKKDK